MFNEFVDCSQVPCGEPGNLLNVEWEKTNYFDCTLPTTLRALLYGRIQNETLHVKMSQVIDDEDCNAIAKIYKNTVEPTLHVVWATYKTANSLNVFDSLPGFTLNQEIVNFFKGYAGIKAYLNDQNKTCIVVIENCNLKRYHLAQVALPKMLPWCFEKPLTQSEVELLQTFAENSLSNYIAKLNALIDEKGAKKYLWALSIEKIGEMMHKKEIEELEGLITNDETSIEALEGRLRKVYYSLNEKKLKMSALICDKNQWKDESFAYFIANNEDICYFNVANETVLIEINGYLDIYDSDAFSTIMSNPNSWYRIYKKNDWSYEDYVMLLTSIFGDNPKFKVRVAQGFKLDLNRYNVCAAHVSSEACQNRLCNPHLEYYNCFGGYGATIIKHLANRKYIDAISICVTSLHSVNVTESASFSKLLRDLSNTTIKCLEAKDGTLLTPNEAIAKIKEEGT